MRAPAKNRDYIKISIEIHVGDQVMVVSDRSPLALGGDRRRWRKRIATLVSEKAEILGLRFGGDLDGGTDQPAGRHARGVGSA